MSGALDLATIRRAMEIFAEELRRHREEIDSLNVYPVPDGDTGTNLLLTQEAVVDALASTDPDAVGSDELRAVIARASLMGARGNSGVILSQILRGICERLPEDGMFEPEELASALEHAAEEAHRAVARPADGTILSVMRDAARAASNAARSSGARGGAAPVIEAALEEARRSLDRTTDLLPELNEARVVDAGGKGIVLLLDALRAAALGLAATEPVGAPGPVGRRSTSGAESLPDVGHEVQYLLEADDSAIAPLRRALEQIGTSLVVVGGGGLFSVHVHTNEPERAVEVGARAGRAREVRIADLSEQVAGCLGGQARAVRVAEQACAMVALAEAEGLERTFRSLGAVVVGGFRGDEPSAADLAAAAASIPAETAIVLAADGDAAAEIEQAIAGSSKEIRVVRTRSIPARLTAAAAFNPMATLADNAKMMEEAAQACRSGAIDRVERDTRTLAGRAKRGDWVGVAEDEVVAVGGAVDRIAVEVVHRLASETSELITLIEGEGAAPRDRRSVETALRALGPGLDVDVVDGGQPGHPFLIGVE